MYAVVNEQTRKGSAITAEEGNEYQELTMNAMELMVNVGLMCSVSAEWPELVQEAWVERIRGMTYWMQTQVDEVQEFASSYD